MNKEEYLKSIIEQIVGSPCGYSHPKLNQEDLKRIGLADELLMVYKKLGGTMNEIPINYRWDITYPNFIIELDEELHFNRYRFETLQSSIYNGYKNFDVEKYRLFCQIGEDKCLKAGSYGGKWKNNSTERQFLPSNVNGILEDTGSSRWKQRAFYDLLKDVYAVVSGIPVIRISIYDTFQDENIDSILSNCNDRKAITFSKNLLKHYNINL